MKIKKYASVGVGSTSIIMIFVVLCLTTFAILSFASATAGYSFSEKNMLQLTAYYTSQETANKKLKEIDLFLLSYSEDSFNYPANILSLQEIEGVTVFGTASGFTVKFSTAITENRELLVELRIPSVPSATRYTITKWISTATSFDYDNDEPLNVWDGN